MYSSAFTDCVMTHERGMSPDTDYQRTIRLKVRAPQLRYGERLALVGESAYLGVWDSARALPMYEHDCHEWVVSLDADCLTEVTQYKFIILGKGMMWEDGANRILKKPEMQANEVVVYELQQARFGIPQWKGAGTVIPVFSLRSEGSFGVGDFGDLKMMVDWCAKTGQNILQILPINDSTISHTWQDSYPYNSISIYALHPQYADLRQLPAIKDEALRAKFEALRQELNALPQIDYERMITAKMDYLRAIFQQEAATVKRRTTYKRFVDDNRQWLEPYARFCFYRDKYGTATFSEWPTRLPKADTKVTDFWYFVQYILDQQMRGAHEHARKNRVILKGDIPIGISRDGVEAWVEPRYFNLNGQAGAPPDAFCEDGQNWGFPTYNWDEMLKDDCSWWVRRFRKMAEYFDAYRIDHVLGFFRIWEIPMPEKSGLLGQFAPALGMSREEIEAYGIYGHLDDLFLVDHKRNDRWHPRISIQSKPAFQQLRDDEKACFNHLYNDYFYHRNNQYWYNEAMKKLPRLTQATRMLVCAEDLGMVPECVPWVMNELRILSLEIQSMPKDPQVRFGQLPFYPYRSVCTISTHDMPTLRQWWDEDEARTQDYYNSELHYEGVAPHPMPADLCKGVVARHLMSPSMLCLLSLQDWLSIDEHLRLPDANAERINIPANPRHYWRYRMHLTIEQLLNANEFNREVMILIKQGGR
jgi:4-alpha-glucanotransferase